VFDHHPAEEQLGEANAMMSSTGYAYRTWTVGDKKVVVRTEFDALRAPDAENRRHKLRALYEYHPKLSGDYRRKLDTFRG
jgi:hypothetical protein